MFNFIEKIIDKLQVNFNFLNRNQSPSYKQKQLNSSGDNIGRDKITIYNNYNTKENLNLKNKVKNSEEKLNYFRGINKYFKKIGIIHYVEAGVDFSLTTTPAIASINPKSSYTVWHNIVTITTRPVELTKISFRKNGNTYNTDLKNFQLYIDGFFIDKVASSDIDNYVTFDLIYDSPKLKTGARVIQLVADINRSAGGKYFSFSSMPDKVDFIDSEMHTKIESTHGGKEFKEITSGEQKVN